MNGKSFIKRTAIVILGLVMTLSLFACGKSSNLAPLSGTYYCESAFFDIGTLKFKTDGTVTFYMDRVYTGTYKAKGDIYILKIKGGQDSISDLLADEKNDAMKITAKPNKDGTLTVSIEAKSGWIYYGDPSARFIKASN